MSNRVIRRVWVWCEDGAQEAFARRLLQSAFGLDRRAVHVNKAPEGKGAASSWGARQYRDEVVTRYAAVRNHQAGLGFWCS